MITAPTDRELEEALAALCAEAAERERLASDPLYRTAIEQERQLGRGTAALLYASRLLAASSAFREAAKAARPVVEEWLAQVGPKRPQAVTLIIACVWTLVGGPIDTACSAAFAAYDRYCDRAPPPDGEPEEVAILCHALAVLAVREMEAWR